MHDVICHGRHWRSLFGKAHKVQGSHYKCLSHVQPRAWIAWHQVCLNHDLGTFELYYG